MSSSERQLAIVLNGQLLMHFDRSQRLAGLQRRALEQMDAKLDAGIPVDGLTVEDPDPMLRAQFVASLLIGALLDGKDQKAASLCGWLATRIPDLQVVQALENAQESKIEMVFDKSFEQLKNEHPVHFVKLN